MNILPPHFLPPTKKKKKKPRKRDCAASCQISQDSVPCILGQHKLCASEDFNMNCGQVSILTDLITVYLELYGKKP